MNFYLKKSASYFTMFLMVLILSAFTIQGEEHKKEPSQKQLTINERIDELFNEMNSIDSPGASVAVVKDGIVVYRNGFGSAQLEYNIPITPSTVFHVASVSKQFTCMAISMLEAQGKLSADDDVRKYLPELPGFGKKITLLHLMNHTSGLRDQWELLMMAGWRMEDVITQEDILTLVKRQKELNFNPGERYLYCNTGYTLLAEVVSKVTGQPFEEWTQENIFNPLGMLNTHFHKNHQMIVKNRAYSYSKNDKKEWRRSILNYANVGATSLFTTVEDMANWMRNFDEKRVGDDALFKKMITKGVLNDKKETSYGRGLGLGDFNGIKYIGHGGADAGFRSHMIYVPKFKLGVVILSNFASAQPNRLARQIAMIYAESALKQHSKKSSTQKDSQKTANKKEKKEKKKSKKKKPIKLNAKKMKAFTGTFWLKKDKLLRNILFEKGKLYYVRNPHSRSELIPMTDTKFPKFKMKGFPILITVTFADKKENHYQKISVFVEGDDTIDGNRIDDFKPTKEDLKIYTGRYYSDELDVYYRLHLEEDALVLKNRTTNDAKLKPLPEDNFTFVANWGNLEFQRDKEGNISGFKLTGRRVLNLKFIKIKD
jgi:CubicO group peptidase (beta-lactamase class C family)